MFVARRTFLEPCSAVLASTSLFFSSVRESLSHWKELNAICMCLELVTATHACLSRVFRPEKRLSMGDSKGQKVRNFFATWELGIYLVCPSTQVAVPNPCKAPMALVMCAQVAVPDPIPLDPARDVPLDTLGSTWIVAAGPSAPEQPDYRGAHLFPQHPKFHPCS